MFGLVLSGGLSSRMGRDKGNIVYPPSKLTQRERCVELLSPFCERVFVSCRSEQKLSIAEKIDTIVDSVSGEGPGIGILSAEKLYPGRSWLVLACDFPWIQIEDVEKLVRSRSPVHASTAYVHSDGTLEPLFAIWERGAIDALAKDFENQCFSPRKTLLTLGSNPIEPLSTSRLANVNSQADPLQP